MTTSRIGFVLAALLVLPSLCLGQTTFDGGGDGTTWEDADNWDAGLPAGNNTNIENGFAVTLGAPAVTAELSVAGDLASTDGQLDHSAGDLTGSGWLKIGHSGNTGTYNLSGTASASGYSLALIGRGAGAGGNLSVSDTATINAEKFGFGEEGGTGNLVISGGSISTGGGGGGKDIEFNNDSTAMVSGGIVSAENSFTFNNSSSLTFSNGMITAAEMFVRDNATVNQTGGSLTTSQWIEVGNDAAGSATYDISGGSMTSNSDWITAGSEGVGNLLVSGNAEVNANGLGMIVGRNSSGVGLLEITGSDAAFNVADLRVAINSDGSDVDSTGTLSFIADMFGISTIVSADNTELGLDANLSLDLTNDADFTLFGLSGPTIEEFLLIDNAALVSGIFAGLGEGSLVDIGGGKFGTISYIGGMDGFDVVVSVAGGVTLGDANGDGVLSNLDIAPFVLALTNPVAYQAMFPDVDTDVVLDMNGDDVFDNLDIADFVVALTGGKK